MACGTSLSTSWPPGSPSIATRDTRPCTLPHGSVAFPRKPSPPLPPLSDRLDHLLVNQASFRFRIRYSRGAVHNLVEVGGLFEKYKQTHLLFAGA